MTIYGYVRVSSTDQNPERQVEKMLKLGVDRENIFIDKASGKNLERESYKALMSVVTSGDSIYFDSLDRLGRDYFDIINEWQRLTRKEGVALKCLDLEFFDSAKFSDMGDIGTCVEDMLLSLLAYVAQTERKKIKQRQAEGIAIAKAAGKYRGRQNNRYTDEQIRAAQDALDKDGKTAAAQVLGVKRQTIYRMIQDGRLIA